MDGGLSPNEHHTLTSEQPVLALLTSLLYFKLILREPGLELVNSVIEGGVSSSWFIPPLRTLKWEIEECKGTKSLIHPMGEVAYKDGRFNSVNLALSKRKD
jgi:hypothetical protein|nr:hypothetical protein Q903MT_gene1198 [Picea sitchensis]